LGVPPETNLAVRLAGKMIAGGRPGKTGRRDWPGADRRRAARPEA
jgi:hypothetical protein